MTQGDGGLSPSEEEYCDTHPEAALCGGDPDDDLSNDNDDEQTDVTEWLFGEFAPEAEYLRENYFCSLQFGYSHYHRCLLDTHQELFGNGMRYDIKLKMKNIYYGAIVLCGNQGCKWVDYSAAGNILYGYLSASRGVSQKESWLAAGLRETLDNKGVPNWEWSSWFDNPGDKAAVDFGYALYAEFGENLTFSDFQTALTSDVLNSFQAPVMDPYAAPVQQENSYPSGFFLNP